MQLTRIRALRGPNVWSRRTALEVTVDLGPDNLTVAEFPGVEKRLHDLFPDTFSGAQWAEGDRASAAGEGATLAHVLERVAMALQKGARVPVSFSRTTATNGAGVFKVVVEYREEDVARAAVEAAVQVIDTVLAEQSFDVLATLKKLRSMDEDLRLGPSTRAIVRAAEARGVPTRRLNGGSLVQLGWGSRQRRILAAETDRTSAIGESIAQDKELTKLLLRSVGVPVPSGGPVKDADEAWELAQEIGVPVVVKPQHGNQGRGVAVNLTTREQVHAAFQAARAEGSSVMVECFAPGADHRLLVVGDRMIAAARRDPPCVQGDGKSTVAELVAVVNADPCRGEDHSTSLSKMRLDVIGLAVLAGQGYTPGSIPAAGTQVFLRQNGNLSTGGSATDVTDRVHPENAARAVDAARVIGLDIAGVDVICCDISRPMEEQGGIVVEVNAAPGLRMHLDPSVGKPRPVGEAIVSTMFPPGENGRIPLVAVAGTNGKTTTVRMVGHILRASGRHVGMACTDGIYIDDRRIDTDDCSGPRSARAVLFNPRVDAAVLETARGGILREGLGFDMCDVAIVTNIGEGDHLGMAGIDTAEQLAEVKRTVVENVAPTGAAVLNAEDSMTVAMAPYCPGSAIFFSRDPQHPLIVAHRARGGRAVVVRNDVVVLVEGNREQRVTSLSAVPLTRDGKIGFQVDNVLAATAAGWSVGVPCEVMRAALATFTSDTRSTPGRFNVLDYEGATIVVDYGHNADALVALIDAIGRMPHDRRVVVYTAAGDRRNVDIIRQAEIIGNGFDHVIIYEDKCTRGRPDGEVVSLMHRGLARSTRVAEIIETRGEFHAIETGLRMLLPGDLILVQVDQVDPSLAFIEQFVAANRMSAAPAARSQANAPAAQSEKRALGLGPQVA
ncbi:MAG: cyanophycin synthetase [Polyangia bacterium]